MRDDKQLTSSDAAGTPYVGLKRGFARVVRRLAQ